MGAFADLIASGVYKRFVRHQWGIYPGEGPLYEEPEITPLPGSKLKLVDVLRVTVVDDVGIGTGNFYWYIYLYDFVKTGEKIRNVQTIYKDTNIAAENVYFDDTLDEKLGGEKQNLGG